MKLLAIVVAVLALAWCSDSHDTTADTSSTYDTTDASRAHTKLVSS
jgi:hypothetical protein